MQKYDRMKTVFVSDLKPRARLVLQCLIYHADKDGMCFPALKTIAAECGYGLTTVKTALKELCEAGYIRKEARFDERKNGGQTSNLYTLCDVDTNDRPDTVNDNTDTNETEKIAFVYTFADGIIKIVKEQTRKSAPFSALTGGQSIFVPP